MSNATTQIRQEKRELRGRIYQCQKELPETFYKEADAFLQERLMNHSKFKMAKTVLSYWSMPREAKTHDVNEEATKTKTILLPVIRGDELLLKKFTGTENLRPEGKYNIMEPVGEEFQAFESIDLIVCPGVAFTALGDRCGHGKGYYDRLLAKIPNAYTLGYGYAFQRQSQVPTDHFDKKLDEVLFSPVTKTQ